MGGAAFGPLLQFKFPASSNKNEGKKTLCQLGSVDQAWSAVMDDLVQSFFGLPSHCDVSLLCEHAHCHTVPALFALLLFSLPDWPFS